MSQPVRVLHVFGRMNRGGAETFIMNVFRHIDRERVQFDFAVHSPEPGHYDEEIRELGGRIFILPRPRLSGLLGYRRALKKVLAHEGPFGAVHSHVHFFSGIPLTIAKAQGVPIRIAHSHSTADGNKDTPVRMAYRWCMRELLIRNATHMMGCSRHACEALFGRSSQRATESQVLRNAIDLGVFETLPQDRKVLRYKLGFPADAPLIGHVGRFDIPKNHRFIIEIFASLVRKIPDAYLILVGDGPLRPQIQRLVVEKQLEGRVLFLGVRSDVPEIMGSLDLYLFPSLWEGLPVVVLEAQAAGVPCLVSDAVPEEADLGVGLWHACGLTTGLKTWVECALQALQVSTPSWDSRKQVIRAHGYDVRQTATFLEGLYVGL